MDINKIPPDVARIDVERCGQTMLLVKAWKRGFDPNDAGAPAFEDFLDAISIFGACDALKAQGFSVTMATQGKARALRGPVTRIDFVKQTDGWHVRKYPAGWTASTHPMSDVVKPESEIREAIQWCRNNGWTVRDFENEIVRAWKGKPEPVHTAETIRRLRAKYPITRKYDFAYDA